MNIARALSIRGWMSERELLLLAEMASCHKRIVEVGAFCGRSTRALADNTDGTVLSIDPWDGMCQAFGMTVHSNGYTNEFKEYKKNLEDHILSGKVDYSIAKFRDIWLGYNPDMIFIDAIHSYDECKADILHAKALMKNGGLLVGHDFCDGWPGVIQAVLEMLPNGVDVKETIWYAQL